MKIDIYVHSNKETAYDCAKEAGITDEEVLHQASYLGYEHKLTFEVDPKTGLGILIAVDDRKLEATP